MKERKFKTPVSMKVAQEQYERDLKEPLKKLGYVEWDMGRDNSNTYLLSNWNNIDNNLGMGDIDFTNRRTLIDHYNPELFLALAAMTEGEKPIKGEYIVTTGRGTHWMETDNVPIGTIYKICSAGKVQYRSDTYYQLNGGGLTAPFRKVTKEELINHFTKKEEVDYKVPGTKLPDTTGLDYICPMWKKESPYREMSFKCDLVSHGYEVIRGAIHIKCEVKDYKSSMCYLIKESDIIKRANELNKPKEMKKKEIYFTLEGLQKLIKVACSSWQQNLMSKYGLLCMKKGKAPVNKQAYDEMVAACSDVQLKVLLEVLGDHREPEIDWDKPGQLVMHHGGRLLIITSGIHIENLFSGTVLQLPDQKSKIGKHSNIWDKSKFHLFNGELVINAAKKD